MKKTIKIEGMSCGHCVAAAKKALMAVEGVSEVDVNLENKNAEITFAGAEASDSALRAAVEDAGFTMPEL